MLENQNSPDAERIKKTILNKAGCVLHAENTFVSERKSRQGSALLYTTSLALARKQILANLFDLIINIDSNFLLRSNSYTSQLCYQRSLYPAVFI